MDRVTIERRFKPTVRGYIIRSASGRYRPATYGRFLKKTMDLVLNGYKVNYEVGVRFNRRDYDEGKRVEYYDTFVMAYVKLGKTTVDVITFYAVKRYKDRKLSIIRPTDNTGRYYSQMKKRYKLCKAR